MRSRIPDLLPVVLAFLALLLAVFGALFVVSPARAQSDTPTVRPTSTPWSTPVPGGGGWPTDLPTLPVCEMTPEPSVTPLVTIDIPTMDIPCDDCTAVPTVEPTPTLDLTMSVTPTSTATVALVDEASTLFDIIDSPQFSNAGDLFCDVNNFDYAHCFFNVFYTDTHAVDDSHGQMFVYVNDVADILPVYTRYVVTDISNDYVVLFNSPPYPSEPPFYIYPPGMDGFPGLPEDYASNGNASLHIPTWELYPLEYTHGGSDGSASFSMGGEVYITTNTDLLTATPTSYPTAVPTGVPTDDPGPDPCDPDPDPPICLVDCIDFDKPIFIPGPCITVVPYVSSWDISWLDWVPGGGEPPVGDLPDTLTIPGFSICVTYLVINASAFGFDLETFLIMLCGLTAISIVFRQLSS